MANRQPLGSFTRDAVRALTKPLVHSRSLRVLQGREAIADVRGRGCEGGTGVFTAPTRFRPDHRLPPAPTPAPAPAPRRAGHADIGAATASTTPAVPTKDEQLDLYIAGDSEAGASVVLEPMLERLGWSPPRSTSRCRPASPAPTSSTGPRACRRRWPRSPGHRGRAVRRQRRPGPERPTASCTTGRRGGHRVLRRVGAMMDFLSADGRKLIWVGTPNARDDGFTPAWRCCATPTSRRRPSGRVTLVDTWAMFQSPNGGYADFIVDDDGEAKLMRQDDGFHLNLVGAPSWSARWRTRSRKRSRPAAATSALTGRCPPDGPGHTIGAPPGRGESPEFAGWGVSGRGWHAVLRLA